MSELENRIRSRIENAWVSARQQAGIIYRRVDNNPKLEGALERAELPLGKAIRRIGLTSEVEVASGNEQLEFAQEHLRQGTLIVASPIHRSIYDGLPTVQIIEALFGKDMKHKVWPWSYKYLRKWIPDLAPRLPMLHRIAVRGFIEASGILPIWVIQPKYRFVTKGNREIIEQLDRDNQEIFVSIRGKPGTLIHTYVTGTRQNTGQLERPQKTGMMTYLRWPGAKLVPITHSLARRGSGRVLRVNIGDLISAQDVRTFKNEHVWTPQMIDQKHWNGKDSRFTSDDALMALIAETTELPIQKSGVNPRGIYRPENYQEISGLGK